jgi:hypothetical protein
MPPRCTPHTLAREERRARTLVDEEVLIIDERKATSDLLGIRHPVILVVVKLPEVR